MRTNAFVSPFLLLLGATLVGCETGGARSQLDASIAAYDSKDYSTALTRAEAAASAATTTTDADDAAYMAGMSAFRLGNYQAAERWLVDATRSSSASTAGEAGIMLGNARLKLSRPREAASAFAAAAQKLQGEEARKARIAAANAFKEAGDSRAADEQFRLANVPTTVVVDAPAAPVRSSGPSAAPNQPVGASTPSAPSGPYVLQAGAFREKAKAENRAVELRAKSVRSGLGEPRISTKRGGDGAPLYVVQIGGFSDRRSADTAVTKLGAAGVVVIRSASGANQVSQVGSS